jgi:hypothetical protein
MPLYRGDEATAARAELGGVASKWCDTRLGECKDWRKVKTVAWREANRERWRLFESNRVRAQ